MEEVDPVQDSVSSISNEDNVSLSDDIAHFSAGKLQNSFKISTKHIFLQISNRVQNLGTSAPLPWYALLDRMLERHDYDYINAGRTIHFTIL